MCFHHKLTESLKARSPRLPLNRHHRELVKPKLSRKIVSSARVNLNDYWSQFEELSKQEDSIWTYDMASIAKVADPTPYLPIQDIEINDNLINELKELGNE